MMMMMLPLSIIRAKHTHTQLTVSSRCLAKQAPDCGRGPSEQAHGMSVSTKTNCHLHHFASLNHFRCASHGPGGLLLDPGHSGGPSGQRHLPPPLGPRSQSISPKEEEEEEEAGTDR